MWIRRDGELPPSLGKELIAEVFPELTVFSRMSIGSLPPKAMSVLVKKDISGYKSNSEAEFAAVLSLVRKGWDDDAIVQLFEECQPAHYMKRGEKWFRKQMLKKARKIISTPPTLRELDSVLRWINDHPWPKITGSTDRLILLACYERARFESPFEFRATQRELKELSGIASRKTVRNSIRRLISWGIIHRVATEKLGHHFCFSRQLLHYPSIHSRTNNGVKLFSLGNHDVWHPKALGRSALEVYDYLLKQNGAGIHPQGISECIGKHQITIKRALLKLSSEGMAEVVEENYYIGIPFDSSQLDKIASRFETLGKGAERKRRHQEERAIQAYRRLIGS